MPEAFRKCERCGVYYFHPFGFCCCDRVNQAVSCPTCGRPSDITAFDGHECFDCVHDRMVRRNLWLNKKQHKAAKEEGDEQ